MNKLLELIWQLENVNEKLLKKHKQSCAQIDKLLKEKELHFRENKKQVKFLSKIIHSIGNSLTILRLILAQEEKTMQKDNSQVVKNELGLIEDSLDKLLQIFEVEYNKKKSPKKFNLSKFVKNIVINHKNNLHKWEHKIEENVFIIGHKSRIEVILENLLKNAQKYTEKSKKISVLVYKKGNKAVLEVKDQGCGISATEKKKIFQDFWRSPAQKNKKIRGSGLGLSLVKKIVKNHGGRVEVSSTLGKGSSFIVVLPLIEG